jgi:hypothetical protein
MDTGGRDRFSDFVGSPPGSALGATGSGSPVEGGAPDPCRIPIEASLEEVALCDYFISRGAVPPVGAEAALLDTLIGGRLAVACDGLAVGYLPVRYNYVARDCIPAGISYVGEVVSSENGAIPSVAVVLQPQ